MLMQTALAAITNHALLRHRSSEITRHAPTPRPDSRTLTVMALYAGWVRLLQGKTKTRAATPRASLRPSAV